LLEWVGGFSVRLGWLVSLFFVQRRADAGPGQIFAQMFDLLLIAYTAVVGVMQKALDLIQHDVKTGAMTGLNIGAEVVQQRFDFTPVNVAADGILKYGAQQI